MSRRSEGKCVRVNKKLTCASLFSGIGGIELGLHEAGHETFLFCENDPGAQAVLRARFPATSLERDVCELTSLPGETTLLTAGFPCQDLSQAGKTRGIEGSRSGLVGEVFRLLRLQRVPWLLIENVPFMLQLARGEAMEVIVSALEEMGYRWAYRVVDSRAFGVPQRRERVYLVATTEGDPRDVLLSDEAAPPRQEGSWWEHACGFYWTEGIRGLGWAVNAVPTLKGGSTIGIPSQPAIIFPDGRVAKPDIRDAERLQGFAADWTKPAEAVVRAGARWKLVGNAVTVNSAAWIGRKLGLPAKYDDTLDVKFTRAKGSWPRAAWNLGEGRHASMASAFPIRERAQDLEGFLRYPLEPLSSRATRGFLARTTVSSLRFPIGFLDKLELHQRRMDRVELVAA